MNMQEDETSPGCSGIKANSTKVDMALVGWACVAKKVDAVNMKMYHKSDCSGPVTSITLAADSCLGGEAAFTCKVDEVTMTKYAPAMPGVGACKGAKEASMTFKTGDDKCHAEPTEGGDTHKVDCKGKHNQYCGPGDGNDDEYYLPEFEGACFDKSTCDPKHVKEVEADRMTCKIFLESSSKPGKCFGTSIVFVFDVCQHCLATTWSLDFNLFLLILFLFFFLLYMYS